MAAKPSARLWIKLTLPGVGQIGPGKIELLRQIGERQSISAAARAMGMSYRRAWLLVDEMNGLFVRPLVVKWQGGQSKGGAALTPLGRELVDRYDALVERAREANVGTLAELGRHAAAARKAPAAKTG